MEYREIIYAKQDGVAKIIINRPHRLNAFTALTLHEIITALLDAWFDDTVGVVVLTGAGDRAFCTGGDQTIRTTAYAAPEVTLPVIGQMGMLESHVYILNLIRSIPKPVIAAVNGYAIGGGHVFQVVCDLTIAAETAKFGQVGPRVGSFDAGYGSAYLARIVGEKKAREIWYLCRTYTAQEALEMGLVNKVVPLEKLEAEVDAWCKEILAKSPTALAFLKASFNADTDHLSGIHVLGSVLGVGLYYRTDEAQEGLRAFQEKRQPDFAKYRKKMQV